MIKKVFVEVKNLEGLDNLEKDIAFTLNNHGHAEWISGTVELQTPFKNTINLYLDKDKNSGVVIGCLVTPNLIGFDKIDVYIYPKKFDFPNVDYVREFAVRLVVAVKDCLFILTQLASANMTRNAPRYCCIVVNMGKRQDGSPEVETYKVLLSYGNDIGYEIVKVNSRTIYKINFGNFNLFKDFMNVIIPEFVENRGGVRE
jgi:hypothetical protein